MRGLIFILGLIISTLVQADIGNVTENSGTAIIKRGKEIITITRGTAVEMNDRIETKNGKVKITFKDNTVVNVTESSALVIDDFVYDPKSQSGKLNLKAAEGTVRYASGNIAHNNPNAVNIKTPTAAIAVRGTDFVMSVNEIGSSMVILMPSCDGPQCTSGKIDVNTAHGTVSMDRPYQATIVETASTPPTPPITVNLTNTPIGNNLQISPPRTMSGANVIAAAKSAAEKTGDMKKSENDKDDKGHNEEQSAKDQQERKQVAAKQQQEDEDKATKKIVIDVTQLGIEVGDSSKPNPHITKLYKDRSETEQVGWQYESLSNNAGNYINLSVSTESKALLIVTQDRLIDAYNFNSTSNKAYGLIVINQSFK